MLKPGHYFTAAPRRRPFGVRYSFSPRGISAERYDALLHNGLRGGCLERHGLHISSKADQERYTSAIEALRRIDRKADLVLVISR